MEQFKLYHDSKILLFDSLKHVYIHNGTYFPSVTSVIKVIDKSGPLMKWAIQQTVNYVREKLTTGTVIDEVNLGQVLDDALLASHRTSRLATTIGSQAHDWIAQYINHKIYGGFEPVLPTNENVNMAVQAFLGWEKKHDVKYHLSEQKVMSLQYQYAGTLDVEATVDGKRCVTDLKTSSAIYPEHFLQTASYIQARREETGYDYSGSWILRIDKESGIYEEQFSDRYIDDFDTFLHCLRIYHWIQETKTSWQKRMDMLQ
jgi:genome maintenance exonuclease 1